MILAQNKPLPAVMNAGNSEAASLMQLMVQAAQASPDDYTSSPIYGTTLTFSHPDHWDPMSPKSLTAPQLWMFSASQLACACKTLLTAMAIRVPATALASSWAAFPTA